ncbi:hypothetical protein MTR41_15795, partial [Escherichia coli]|nr:hypothetical protein [Escherichia coli]
MAWNTDVSADGEPHSLWKQRRALASQPESVTKTKIAENRIHRSGVNARRQKPLSAQSPSDLNKKHTAKWHLNRSQFGIRIDHDLASISDHSLASQSIT